MLSLLPLSLPSLFGVSSTSSPKVRPPLTTMSWLPITGKLLVRLLAAMMPSTTRSLLMPTLTTSWTTVISSSAVRPPLLSSEPELKSSRLSVPSMTRSTLLRSLPLVWSKLKLRAAPHCLLSTTMART